MTDRSLLNGIEAGCHFCSMVKKYSLGYETLRGASVLKALFRDDKRIDHHFRKILGMGLENYLELHAVKAFSLNIGDLVLSAREG